MLNIAMKYAQGNPGALMFMMELLSPENLGLSIPICVKLDTCPTLKGTNLYVLWSDLCNKDIGKVLVLCKNCPDSILEDACNRQDYSGRGLVAEYLY